MSCLMPHTHPQGAVRISDAGFRTGASVGGALQEAGKEAELRTEAHSGPVTNMRCATICTSPVREQEEHLDQYFPN